MDSSDSSNKGFFKYVFNFDDNTKSELLNIIQFSVLSLIPVVILNKAMQRYVPEAEEQKGSLEILAEIVIQMLVLFLGLFLVNRIVTFVPTYSGTKYPDFSIINVILIGLVILLSLQTKLGEKVSILTDRINELWEGTVNKNDSKKKATNTKTNNQNNTNNTNAGTVTVSQPISQPQMNSQSQQAAMNQSLSQLPDYNSNYVNANDASSLIGNTSPGMESMMNMQGGFNEPMAANSVLGGSAFGSNF